MKAWQVSVFIGLLALALFPQAWAYEEPAMPALVAPPPAPMTAPGAPHAWGTLSPMIPLAQATLSLRPARAAPLKGRGTPLRSAAQVQPIQPVPVSTGRPLGFERWRRGLPYGVARDPVLQYLTEE